MEQDVLQKYEKAGRIARQALEYGASLIKPGVSMRDVLDKIEIFIHKQGAAPAFPAQSCVNETAAHFCPTQQEDYVYQKGDLIKLDVGVHVDGYIGDNAMTISLDSEYEDLSLTVKTALDTVTKMLRPGVSLNQIGATVQKILQDKGYEPIRNLTGHGVGQYQQHTKPSVPNFPSGDETVLEEGMVIAVEPFGTTGTAGVIYNAANPTIFSLAVERPVRSPHARKVLQQIHTYNGLPFATRWLTQALGTTALLGLNELRRAGMLHEYPPLPEKTKGVVAQWENTFLITKNGCKILTSTE